TLITSELFGHEKGAFTGAVKHRAGRFELANGGTLFLDEIGNIPMEVQNRLLRILETREFQRVGGEETIQSDFRLLTATNENLQEAVKSGRFREDLFYRLNVFPITVPPLRERKEDIPPLAYFFLKNHATRMGKPLEKISKSTMDKLLKYPWPGNVRELENVIERGAILSTGSHFSVPELLMGSVKNPQKTDNMTIEENERRHILSTLEKTGGKIQGKDGAAQLLGIHHNTLHSRMKKLGIIRNSKAFMAVKNTTC
ncbi:MAG: sigma-54-dependent Fis family transcriptional regulator, partial [Desulfobacterales bacterium]|nr:sigma-54-dependent Fis family transcriptional regulator [Desulfobacterales bacterium]